MSSHSYPALFEYGFTANPLSHTIRSLLVAACCCWLQRTAIARDTKKHTSTAGIAPHTTRMGNHKKPTTKTNNSQHVDTLLQCHVRAEIFHHDPAPSQRRPVVHFLFARMVHQPLSPLNKHCLSLSSHVRSQTYSMYRCSVNDMGTADVSRLDPRPPILSTCGICFTTFSFYRMIQLLSMDANHQL